MEEVIEDSTKRVIFNLDLILMVLEYLDIKEVLCFAAVCNEANSVAILALKSKKCFSLNTSHTKLSLYRLENILLRCTKLTKIELHGYQLVNENLSKSFLHYVSPCTALEVLDLASSTIHRHHRKKITKTESKDERTKNQPIFPRLRVLSLNGCDCIGWTEMTTMLQNSPLLEVIDLGSWGRAWEGVEDSFPHHERGDKLLQLLGNYCPKLQKLFIEYSAAAGVTSVGVDIFLRGCLNIREVNFMFAMLWRNVDNVLHCFTEICPNIEFLAFRDIDASENSLIRFVSCCTKLRYFRLYDCDGIWKDTLLNMASHVPSSLETLDLRGCGLSFQDYKFLQDILNKRGKCQLLCA